MRKQTKLVAVLSATALLAIGASMTSFAATGWQEENGTWVYYDKDSNQVTDKWEKSGDRWFYLDSDGQMATDTLVDDGTNFFYVTSDGSMVANQWVSIANENAGEEGEPESNWYYFQANGKAYKSTSDSVSFKTINGKKYTFDSEGKMLYGWVDATGNKLTDKSAWETGLYYCGDENDGAQVTGWKQLTVEDNGEDKNYYFYLNPSNGKKVSDSTAKTINGKKYAFDEKGAMQDGWYAIATGSQASIQAYSFYGSENDGARVTKGWVKTVPSENVNKNAFDDDSEKWFYAGSDGLIYNNVIKTINSKKYAFNQNGEMLSGLYLIKETDGAIAEAKKIENAKQIDAIKAGEDRVSHGFRVYYFGSEDDGSAKTGTQTVVVDGDSYTYSFGTTGDSKFKGLDGVNKTSLYAQGLKITADRDLKYESFNANGESEKYNNTTKNQVYLVNTSGTIMKNKTNLKDSNDQYYSTDDKGFVTNYGDKQK